MQEKYEPARRMSHSVNLDPNAVKIVKEYLHTQNQTLSSWLNWVVVEFAKQLAGSPIPWDKPVAKMTLEELQDVLTYWRKSLEAEEGEE